VRDADEQLDAARRLDPLDWSARFLGGETVSGDTQVKLDLALDFSRAGFVDKALEVLADAKPEAGSGTEPLVSYYRAWLTAMNTAKANAGGRGRGRASQSEVLRHLKAAAKASPDYCFPARLEEIAILEFAMTQNPRDPRAPYYLGNLFYDRRRHAEALRLWERSAKLNPAFSIVWRNLGIGYFNIAKKPARARFAYERAFRANPTDARVLYERDQLWKRMGISPRKRLTELEKHPELTRHRDDLSVELCALLNLTGRSQEAREILASRRFQPWEGGEGQALGQHVRTYLQLGREALAAGDAKGAGDLFFSALQTPENLGEARHLLANQSDVYFWLGEACAAAGEKEKARHWWLKASTFRGDFQEMSVRAFSEMTYYSAVSLERLGKTVQAKKAFRELLAHARKLARSELKVDYFATSLPTMLLFDDDLQDRQARTARFMEAQALCGLGQLKAAERVCAGVLGQDPAHALAHDLADTLARRMSR
jgi:tetratricopeptide (TPR) repeat protein